VRKPDIDGAGNPGAAYLSAIRKIIFSNIVSILTTMVGTSTVIARDQSRRRAQWPVVDDGRGRRCLAPFEGGIL
jgi:hypothetical protein